MSPVGGGQAGRRPILNKKPTFQNGAAAGRPQSELERTPTTCLGVGVAPGRIDVPLVVVFVVGRSQYHRPTGGPRGRGLIRFGAHWRPQVAQPAGISRRGRGEKSSRPLTQHASGAASGLSGRSAAERGPGFRPDRRADIIYPPQFRQPASQPAAKVRPEPGDGVAGQDSGAESRTGPVTSAKSSQIRPAELRAGRGGHVGPLYPSHR